MKDWQLGIFLLFVGGGIFSIGLITHIGFLAFLGGTLFMVGALGFGLSLN